MNKTGALWLNEIRTQLPWLLVFTIFNKIELAWGIPLSLQGDRPLEAIGNTAMLSGRWPDDWPLTFMFFGLFFALWGYWSFLRGRKLKTDTWLRTIPIADRVPAAFKLGTGIVMVAMVFLLDLVSTIAILNATGQASKLYPNYKTMFLLGKGLMAVVFGTWFLAGCWIAQWSFRWRRWHPSLITALVAFFFGVGFALFVALARMDLGYHLRYMDRYRMVALGLHAVLAILFVAMIMRGQKRWQIA